MPSVPTPEGTFVTFSKARGRVTFDRGRKGLSTDDVGNDSNLSGDSCSEALNFLDARGCPTKEVLFGNGTSTIRGPSDSFLYLFLVPHDFSSLLALELIVIPDVGCAGPGKAIDFVSYYAQDGQQFDENSQFGGGLFDLGPADGWATLDASDVFSNLSSSDRSILFVQHNAIGGNLTYMGLRLRYA